MTSNPLNPNESAPVDMSTPPPPPPKTPRGRPLKSQADLRRALASLYRQIEAGSVDVARARIQVYALATLSALHERHELEAELEVIRRSLAAAGISTEPKP